jgi:hypothetical protein
VLREGSGERAAAGAQHGHDGDQGMRGTSGLTILRVMRKTSPHLSATVNATSGYTA